MLTVHICVVGSMISGSKGECSCFTVDAYDLRMEGGCSWTTPAWLMRIIHSRNWMCMIYRQKWKCRIYWMCMIYRQKWKCRIYKSKVDEYDMQTQVGCFYFRDVSGCV